MTVVSVIVPVYNAEKYLCKCIDSILNQTFRDFELLLVDDGSPDGCGAICDEYETKDNRVTVIHKKNGGVSEARNAGLDRAKGDFISFVDPDDWVEETLLQEAVDFLQKNSTDIVCFEVCEIKRHKKFVQYRFDRNKIFESGIATEKILADIIDNSPCNKVYKKEVWNGVRFPVGRRYEDVATIYKTFYNSEKVGYLKKALYYYIKHEGSATAVSFDAQRRYECFLGYKERYLFSQTYCKETEEKCRAYAVKAGISTITALAAGSGHISAEAHRELTAFLHDATENIKYLGMKNRILLWGIQNCPAVNTIYGKLSRWSKKLKKGG